MQEIEITVQHESGLHLRPASLFVQEAASYQSEIQVRNITKNSGYRNAKSAMSVMMLQVAQGNTISIRADGEDEVAAIEGLRDLIERNFDEDQ